MRFSKYHGIGNDFVMLADPEDTMRLTPDLVRALCDRRFGIGGDGVIRVAPGSDDTDLYMDYVNSDGSVGEMCGNGIRCLAVFARDQGLTAAEDLQVGTASGIKHVVVTGDRVRVNMGPPIFRPADIPVKWEGSDALHTKIEVDRDILEVACLSMGNPHAVIFMEHELTGPIRSGPLIERHEIFPNGANVEFVKIITPERIAMRVWERGVGETLACGTGACAAVVASQLLENAGQVVTVELPGGELEVEWRGSLDVSEPVFMTGPAVRSFTGEVDLDAFAR